MARKKNPATTRSAAARSAAHAAPAPDPVPSTGPAPGSPAGAACAALAAHPGGATTAIIADAIGIGRAAARDALTALETAGTVTRTKGGKPGIPDTWTLTSSQPGDDPATGDQDGLGEDETAGGAAQQEASNEASPVPGTGAVPAAVPDGNPGDPDTATGPEQDGGESAGDTEPGPGDSPAVGDSGSAGEPPDPALVAEITGRIEQIQAAASAASTALASGDLRAALAGLDEIYDQASQGRRALKAAAGGRKAPAARPGGLREKVLAHLRDHPGAEFTPHEIHKVLAHSSGAIANALDTLVKHGDAELATEKPRKFRLAATATATAPADADDRAGSDGELAGAA
jgi:hypothetical protein